MKTISISLLLLLYTFPLNISFGNDLKTHERDLDAMESIIKVFCQTKNLCDGEKHGKFTIYKFKNETEKLLSDKEKSTINVCIEKFEARITSQNIESIYIYCYDNNVPKLMIEKVIIQDNKNE